jgi:phytoene dehydrogenase-like protein
MNFFSAFAVSFGSMLLMAALIASWLFRSSGAPLIAKIAVPALIVALACVAPYQVNAMLGFPISALPPSLPAHAELIAFVSHDDAERVDLWLRESNAPPRAYETALNDKLKRTLREAQSRLGHGGRVMLVRARLGAKRTGITEQRAPDDSGYELDDSLLSLPPKA